MQCSSINFRKCWWKFAGLEISVIVQRSVRCYLMHEIKSNCITLRLLVSVTSFWRNLESCHDIVWESLYCFRTKNSTLSPLITQAITLTLSVGSVNKLEAPLSPLVCVQRAHAPCCFSPDEIDYGEGEELKEKMPSPIPSSLCLVLKSTVRSISREFVNTPELQAMTFFKHCNCDQAEQIVY